MDDFQLGPIEAAIEFPLDGIHSVTEDLEGTLYAICQTGCIYTILDRQCQELYNTGGQPSALVYDQHNTGYICDLAHQRIFSQSEGENGRLEVTEVITDYEGKPLLGPSSITYNEENNYIYFTDSGPLGETSLTQPTGSIFAADLELLVLKPIALGALAHPCGISVSPDKKTLFVAETLRNRVLRIAQSPARVHHMSVFYQFSGRLGPTALAISENGMLYVARYEFKENSSSGLISVINQEGTLKTTFEVPEAPEITGLYFSRLAPNVLYITETSKNMCYKVTVPSDAL